MDNSWYTNNIVIYRDHWNEDDLSNQTYLRLIGLKSIEWPENSHQICSHCGSVTDKWPCSGCGSKELTSGSHMGRARVTLYGPLPYAVDIFSFHPDTIFYILVQYCGLRNVFLNNEGGLKLSKCKIVRRVMPGIYSLDPQEQDRIHLQVTIECNVELFTESIGYGQEE